jgi:lactoylglutathione lyase
MKYGYTIIYVEAVEEILEFYKKAFGFEIRFLHESKAYGELDTGDTVLAFASHEMGAMNLDGEYLNTNINNKPFGIELAFVADNVQDAYDQAIAAGALPVKQPVEKPWGQMVSYVRTLEGTIIELCSPMAG